MPRDPRFAGLVEDAPDAPARRRALEAFERLGWPSRREETWRYTDLSDVEKPDWRAAAAADVPDLARRELNGYDQVVFVNGRHAPDASSPHWREPMFVDAPEDEPANGVVALNAALAREGLTLRLDAGGSLSRPLHVLSLNRPGASPAMSHLHHRIVLGAGARAQLVLEQGTFGDGSHLTTERVTIHLGAGAQLRLTRLQRLGDGIQALSRYDATLSRESTLEFDNADLGGRLVRNDLVIRLDQEGAAVTLRGLFLPTPAGHVDNHTVIRHAAADTCSRQLYRGIAGGRGRGVYNGRVEVAPGASGADSGQKVDSLLLSPRAEINAKPELEILHDDVQCSHGATCGQLDPAALHYLRTRGVARAVAEALLVRAFAAPALADWPDALRPPVDAAIDSVLAAAAP